MYHYIVCFRSLLFQSVNSFFLSTQNHIFFYFLVLIFSVVGGIVVFFWLYVKSRFMVYCQVHSLRSIKSPHWMIKGEPTNRGCGFFQKQTYHLVLNWYTLFLHIFFFVLANLMFHWILLKINGRIISCITGFRREHAYYATWKNHLKKASNRNK